MGRLPRFRVQAAKADIRFDDEEDRLTICEGHVDTAVGSGRLDSPQGLAGLSPTLLDH